jgi:hypothetical protein
MKQASVRATVDIPVSLYRKLKEQAAAQGGSTREPIFSGDQKGTSRGPAPETKESRVSAHRL